MQTQDAAFWQIMFSTAPKHKARFITFASLFFFLLLYSNYSRDLSRYINNTQSFTLNYCLRRQGQVYTRTYTFHTFSCTAVTNLVMAAEFFI